jgi:hypothetical protein
MGFADLGALALVFYAKGRLRYWNPTGQTSHADGDYTPTVTSWTDGARSPYAICFSNGWAVSLCDEGLYVCGPGEGKKLISGDLYRSSARTGERGELEYAIAACIAASESGSDDYALSAQVHGMVLSVRYAYSADEWREVRYDFSLGEGLTGPQQLLQPNGAPYPWSTPQTLPVVSSAWVAEDDGLHHYAARDTNAGATDGRVDEVDTGTTDNGVAVEAVGYTGLDSNPDGPKMGGQYALVTGRKVGTSLSVAVARDPEALPEDAVWDEVPIPASGYGLEFFRALVDLPAGARVDKSALAFRIKDDGSGECSELSGLTIMAEPQDFK